MANDNKTFAEIVKWVRRECNSYPLPNAAGEKLKLVREMEDAHNREVDELKTQIKIAKDAFFNISMCDHSQKIHDIFCEAEFMMNHPELRSTENGNE